MQGASMTYTHRPLVPADAPVLKELLCTLGYPQTDESSAAILRTYTNTGDYYAYAAVHEGVICGVIAWHVRRLFVNARLKVSIESLVVDPTMHRRGVGRYLMGIVEAFAHDAGVWVIELISGKRRASSGAHTFYNSLGYQNEGAFAKVYLRKVLPENK
jgi:GNAT superfamily N-acetyltransferase